MSEDTNKEDIIPAKLEEGEPIISAEYAEANKEAIQELVEKYNEFTKIEVSEETKDDAVITSKTSSSGPKEVKAMGLVENGAIGSTTKKVTPKKPEAAKPVKDVETVAVFSSKSVNWAGVGKISRGYNILEKSVAEKWLSRWHCREATPEEVAREYGK